MTRVRTTLFSVTVPAAVLALGLGAAGCANNHKGNDDIGTGTSYTFSLGKLSTTENTTLDRAYEATKAALGELQFPIKRDKKDALQAEVFAEQATGTDVKVYLTRKTETATGVEIRVGLAGDEDKSRTVLERIRKNVGGGVGR